MAQRLQQISKEFFQVHQGCLYPALHRLEDRGLQVEWKESETSREAKLYSLTKTGRRQTDAEVVNCSPPPILTESGTWTRNEVTEKVSDDVCGENFLDLCERNCDR
jgi:DNA-binding PadR family transcriptional regulator